MSAPQDIQSILAALAAQQKPSASAPPAQTAAPPASSIIPGLPQPPTYLAAPSYGAPNYGVPPPPPSVPSYIPSITKPAVSFDEAIAQTKAFAAQKGVSSYSRDGSHDYRHAPSESRSGRPSYGGRSRSRSPVARREAFRDNYNPYRDERREEHSYGGRDYGDPRARAPPRRSPGHDDDNSTFEIYEVNANLVGLVIGRSGENLRRIENETGCRVQFLGTSESGQRECKITGPKPRREEVKAQIEQTIADSGALGIPRPKSRAPNGVAPGVPSREGEDHMQIMVPDRTVGLIIGRKGETISDLQERSGCHINIVDETKSVDGLRPVNLIGTPEQTQRAKDMIMQIVDSDSREGGGSGNVLPGGPMKKPFSRDPYGGPRDNYGGRNGPSGNGDTFGIPVPTGPDVINDEMYVPSEAVGMIIGKKGETIREIQANSGCKINVNQGAPNGDDSQRVIGLIGNPSAIRQAKDAISERLDTMRQRQANGPYNGPRRDDRSDYDSRGRSGPRDGGYTPHNNGYNQGPSISSHNSHKPSDNPAGAPAGGDDPYAQYGGYQNYLSMWYQQWMNQANTGAGQPPAGQAPVSQHPR